MLPSYTATGRSIQTWFLSAYEFMVYWRIEIASFNRDPKEDADNPGHCVLTACGQQKVYAAAGHSGDGELDLKPGVDYRVRERPAPDENWLPLQTRHAPQSIATHGYS